MDNSAFFTQGTWPQFATVPTIPYSPSIRPPVGAELVCPDLLASSEWGGVVVTALPIVQVREQKPRGK